MKASEVIDTLNISRSVLYSKRRRIKTDILRWINESHYRIYIHDDRLNNLAPFTKQLTHFRNMLLILIHKLKSTMGYYPTSEALLYS